MAWRVFAASAIGTSHRGTGQPCQDAHAHRILGDVLVAVVCDGAGSASASGDGAQFISAAIVRDLAEQIERGRPLPAMEAKAFEAYVAESVARAREALQLQAVQAGLQLCDYAATVVGAVLGEAGGYFFHIGDGVAVARAAQDGPELLSRPENGEYANETFFFTANAWRDHLRVTAIAQRADRLALMSDGAQSFVMARGGEALYRPFIDPVERYLAGVDEAEGSRALAATLDDARTGGITGDDKTLLIALRG